MKKINARRVLSMIAVFMLIGVLFAAPVLAGTSHIYRTLYYGDSGNDVAILQKKLRSLGYFDGEIGGNYLDLTQRAVRRFEKANGYEMTNYCTKRMQQIIESTKGDPDVYRTLHYGDNGEDVKNIQRALKKQGYFDGNIGGNYLDLTMQAVRDWQYDNGFKRTDYCTVAIQRYILGIRK